MPKPSNPQNAPKRHGKKPTQPGYQGTTRSTFDGCAVLAVMMLGGVLSLIGVATYPLWG